MHRLRNQEETSKKLKREMKLQSDEQKASRTRAIVEADDQRIRDVQLQYAEKERQMQEQMDKFKRQFEDEQQKLKQKQSLNIQTERERLDRERRRIEQVIILCSDSSPSISESLPLLVSIETCHIW